VEFRLLYQGELLSSGNHSRVENKHAIRKSFHPQLSRLWKTNFGLRQLAAFEGNRANPRPNASEDDRIMAGVEALGKQQSMHGFNWLPVAMNRIALRCSLDILLLRPEGDVPIYGKSADQCVIQGADIDGQIKTLLDALQIPPQLQDLPNDARPDVDETPFFCVLHNDRLISEIRLSAKPLLLLPNTRQVRSCDAFALIHVKLNHVSPGTFDRYYD